MPKQKKPSKTKEKRAVSTGSSHEDVENEEDSSELSEENDNDFSLEDEPAETTLTGDGASGLMVMPADGSLVPIEDSTIERLPAYLDPLKRYLKEISRYDLLTPEAELELVLRLRNSGDLDAAKRLVSANLRLVVKIAMEYRSTYTNVLDLIQEGNIGLMKAVSKFDPTKGAKLSYYASWWIRSYILKYIIDNFRLVKVGTTQAQKKLFYQLIREKERLEAQGLEAGPKLLADRLQVREKDIVEMGQRLSSSGAELSLQAPIERHDGHVSHQDLLEDKTAQADDLLASDEMLQILKEHLGEFAKSLKEKELVVFKERLASDNPKTLQEVADMFGMTRERVRQIETRIIEKLREFYQTYFK